MSFSLRKANSLLKRWSIQNQDTGDILTGQFAAEIGLEIRNNWQHHTAMSRSVAISQFVNCEVDRITVPAYFYATTALETVTVEKQIANLIKWSKPGNGKDRPAVLKFWVGSKFLERTCVIAGLNDVKFGEPNSEGNLRTFTVNINLDAYAVFDINDTKNYRTRYHRTRVRDYYEMLCWREYQIPIMGDIIRKENPSQALLTPGEIVPMPSIEAIRSETVEAKSTALMTAFGRKNTPQRALRIAYFNAHNKPFTSHVAK